MWKASRSWAASRRQLRGQRETRLADDSLYPAGGFASITPGGETTGNIENLVASELVYMDDDEPIDVFALRYVERELLHYTRDDSVLRRHRHLIGIALGADLDDARVKDRDLPWQRLILALGRVVAAIRWLVEQLGDEALTVELVFPPGVLAEERQIVALLLEGEIARGTVAIEEAPWRDTLVAAARAAGTAIADAVVISLGELPELPRGLRVLHVSLAGAAGPRAGASGRRRRGEQRSMARVVRGRRGPAAVARVTCDPCTVQTVRNAPRLNDRGTCVP